MFVGYSMYDLDVARIVYEDPILKSKTCFIDTPELDPVFGRELSQYGEVFPIGVDGFIKALAGVPVPAATRDSFTSFEKYEGPIFASEPTSDDVTSLFVRGEIKDEILLGSRAGSARYAFERASLRTILERIDAGSKKFLIHADIGNGKTILLHLLRLALAQRGYQVLTLKQNYDSIDDDVRLLADDSQKYVVIVEEIFRNSDVVEKVSFAAPHCAVIATARSSTFDLRNNDVEEIFQQNFIEVDLNQLSLREASDLVNLASENGLWGDLSSKSFDQKLQFIQNKCGNEIRSFLLHLLESPSFKNKIRETFYAGIDGEILNCIVVLLFLDVANFNPDLLTVAQLAQVDLLRQAKLKKDQTSREYVDFASGRIRVKSSILSQYILKEIIDYDVSLKYLIKAIRACEVGRRENRLLHEAQKELMKFSFIDKIFARTKNSDHYVQFYDNLRTLPSMARNPQFWLQYAIARIEHSEYKSADVLFRTAYSIARSIPNYNPFQIDNHFARFLLVSRTLDHSYGDYFKAFIDAHGLLIKQARTEQHAYYPFKVARSYYDFVLQNGPKLVPEQKGAIESAIQQMIKQIDRSSKHVLRYRLVQEARGDLVRTSELLKSFG
ncbi:hypothetical protein ABH991_002463 [Bradyrhizobium ottawaense]|uniref:ATP-binding protein n=3 Tax=Nitrobacteraceae TaxID=41294 RepID=A0ABV4FM17_9BRAD|nr:hypothetical protein [Bradyrhizobium sp. CCBAU 25360]